MFDFGGNPHQSFTVQHALPETNIASESEWLQYELLVSFSDGLFSRTMLVLVLGVVNSHGFPMIGMVINLIVGVYIPIIRIPY